MAVSLSTFSLKIRYALNTKSSEYSPAYPGYFKFGRPSTSYENIADLTKAFTKSQNPSIAAEAVRKLAIIDGALPVDSHEINLMKPEKHYIGNFNLGY